MRVFIADRDPLVAERLPPRLRREGHSVAVCGPAEDLPREALRGGAHLVLLEPAEVAPQQAPDVCRLLRQESAAMLLVVSRSSGVSERIRLLDAGADDYMAKPFDEDELLARVRALLRRHPLSTAGRRGELLPITETLSLDLAGQRLVAVGEDQRRVREERLSDTEFRLLAHLVRHEGHILTRDALLQAVWGYEFDGSTREVDVYVRYLRRKLEPDPSRPRYLLTAWGRGYQFRRLATPRVTPTTPAIAAVAAIASNAA